MRLIALSLITSALIAGCSAPAKQPQTAGGVDSAAANSSNQSRYSSATVTRTMDSNGRATNDKITISDPQQLNRVMSYFPEAGQNRRGPLAGGWMPAITIHAHPKNGRAVVIRSNYEFWSEGTGDWPVDAGFRDYIDRLFRQR